MPMESQDKPPRILDQVRTVMRVHHYSIHTERSYIDWIKRYIKQLLGHTDVATTMIYTHVLQQGGQGVPSPLDDLPA